MECAKRIDRTFTLHHSFQHSDRQQNETIETNSNVVYDCKCMCLVLVALSSLFYLLRKFDCTGYCSAIVLSVCVSLSLAIFRFFCNFLLLYASKCVPSPSLTQPTEMCVCFCCVSCGCFPPPRNVTSHNLSTRPLRRYRRSRGRPRSADRARPSPRSPESGCPAWSSCSS